MKRYAVGLGATLFLSATLADAAQYSCDDVPNVATGRGASVMLTSFAGSSHFYLCSLSATYNGVSPDECKSVYATLLAAQLAGKPVRLWFDDALSCSTQPYWAAAAGWYWGPELLD